MWIDDEHYDKDIDFDDKVNQCVESDIGKITFTLSQSGSKWSTVKNVKINGTNIEEYDVQFDTIDEDE